MYALGSQIVSGTMEVSQSVVCYCIDLEIVRYYFTRIGYTQLATANDESMASQIYGSFNVNDMFLVWCGVVWCVVVCCGVVCRIVAHYFVMLGMYCTNVFSSVLWLFVNL